MPVGVYVMGSKSWNPLGFWAVWLKGLNPCGYFCASAFSRCHYLNVLIAFIGPSGLDFGHSWSLVLDAKVVSVVVSEVASVDQCLHLVAAAIRRVKPESRQCEQSRERSDGGKPTDHCLTKLNIMMSQRCVSLRLQIPTLIFGSFCLFIEYILR